VFSRGYQFGVHHDPRDSPVAVVERVNFGNDEHLEYGAGER
jgi:hypothetical protein